MTPLDHIKRGDVEYFKTVELDLLLNYRTEYDDLILAVAVSERQLECCKEILKRCPSQIFYQNRYGDTALHHVLHAENHRSRIVSMLSFLVDFGSKAEDDIESGTTGGGGENTRFKKWVKLKMNSGGYTAMMSSIVSDINAARWWVKVDEDMQLGLLGIPNYSKDTALHYAVAKQDLELVTLLAAREPDFVYGLNDKGDTPLSLAMRTAQSSGTNSDKTAEKIRKLLLEKQPKQSKVRIGIEGWTSLHHAANNGDLGAIMEIIQFCPECTELTDNNGQNFLHLAVKLEKIDIVKNVLDRKNVLDMKNVLNGKDNYGYTPLHIAAETGNQDLIQCILYDPRVDKMTSNAKGQKCLDEKIRNLLLKKQPNQSKGTRGWTLLHHATNNEDLSAIMEIIRLCPECTELTDNDGQNFLHLAVKLEKIDIVKNVLEIKEISLSVLNGKDNYGYTPLHIAAETGNEGLIQCMIYDPRVDKKTSNAKGQQVLDAITVDYDKTKAGVYGVRDRMNEKELKDQSDFDLVVGALIATVSFTAGITVPGGFIADGPNSGMAVLAKRTSFEAFVISNSFALVFSLYAVFSHFCTRRLLRRKDIIYQLNVATLCTLSAIFAMMVAFISGSYAVLAISNRVAITVCANCCCFFIFAFRALWTMTKQHKKFALWIHSGIQ